jgi:hypothetical protein
MQEGTTMTMMASMPMQEGMTMTMMASMSMQEGMTMTTMVLTPMQGGMTAKEHYVVLILCNYIACEYSIHF